MEQIPSIQDLQQDSQVLDTEHLLHGHTFKISIEWTYSPLVICNDRAFTEFVKGEERCLKFINQDLNFFQSSNIPSTFSNISHVSAKVKEFTHIRLPGCILTESNNTLPTQTVKPVLGFTLVEICQAQVESKLTVQQLLEIKSFKDYVKTPVQALAVSM